MSRHSTCLTCVMCVRVCSCCIFSPLGGGKLLLKLSIWNTAVGTNYPPPKKKSRAAERKQESQRGNWHQKWEWDDRESKRKDFQVRVSKCWCKCYFMFHKTGAAHLGWTPRTKQGYWEGSNQLEFLFLTSALVFSFHGPLHKQLLQTSCEGPYGPQ